MKKILITGGAGFIGSHLAKHFVEKYPEYIIVNIDSFSQRDLEKAGYQTSPLDDNSFENFGTKKYPYFPSNKFSILPVSKPFFANLENVSARTTFLNNPIEKTNNPTEMFL